MYDSLLHSVGSSFSVLPTCGGRRSRIWPSCRRVSELSASVTSAGACVVVFSVVAVVVSCARSGSAAKRRKRMRRSNLAVIRWLLTACYARSAEWLTGFRERAQRVAFHHRDGRAVAVGDAVAGDGADALAAGENAGEVERIGGADDVQNVIGRGAADLAQFLDRLGQRELLAGHAGDEAAAADLAARVAAAVDARQVAPRRGVGLARGELAEDDAVAAKEDARLQFGVDLVFFDERPASGERSPFVG